MCIPTAKAAPAPYVAPPPPAPVVEEAPTPDLKTVDKGPARSLKIKRTTPNQSSLTVKRTQSAIGGVDAGGVGLSTVT
jgi:hypothetical protein